MGFRATLNFRKFKVALNPKHFVVTVVILVTVVVLECAGNCFEPP